MLLFDHFEVVFLELAAFSLYFSDRDLKSIYNKIFTHLSTCDTRIRYMLTHLGLRFHIEYKLLLI